MVYILPTKKKNPIAFNPFYISEGEILDTEKKESLKTLLISLWKQENENFNRSEYVALSNALQGYYQLLDEDKIIFPCFNTFYEYVETHYTEILRGQRVKREILTLTTSCMYLNLITREVNLITC